MSRRRRRLTASLPVPRLLLVVMSVAVGGCTDVKALGPLDRWIPSEGYDLYVIGLQARPTHQLHLRQQPLAIPAGEEGQAPPSLCVVVSCLVFLLVCCRGAGVPHPAGAARGHPRVPG